VNRKVIAVLLALSQAGCELPTERIVKEISCDLIEIRKSDSGVVQAVVFNGCSEPEWNGLTVSVR
jgi:hypothetical protein